MHPQNLHVLAKTIIDHLTKFFYKIRSEVRSNMYKAKFQCRAPYHQYIFLKQFPGLDSFFLSIILQSYKSLDKTYFSE